MLSLPACPDSAEETRTRRTPDHSRKRSTAVRSGGPFFFSSSPASPFSAVYESHSNSKTHHAEKGEARRLIGSQPFELLICFCMTNGESRERHKQGQRDCSHETKGSLSPRLQYISVDNATALRTCGRTRAHAGSARLGEGEAINQTNSITAWRRKHSNR